MNSSAKVRIESIFFDSGAHTLYNRHGSREWGRGDFSYYDLSEGTEFRRYCDSYAHFMKKVRRTAAPQGKEVLFANVDAISNPDLTWEIQRFFEKAHGVQPVPVVHYGTPMEHVDRYLEAGRYDLLGVGGLGQGVNQSEYPLWGDELFNHAGPAIKTHGFAMTSWELISRYPWTSVDSATWVKLAAYGWVYLPRWSPQKGWRFDQPPRQLNFSHRSPQRSIAGTHYENVTPEIRETAHRWLKHIGLSVGPVAGEASVKDFGVSSHARARSLANLIYFKHLENKTRIYFSGSTGLVDTPEALIPEMKPHIMLTYHNIHLKESGTIDRMEAYLESNHL